MEWWAEPAGHGLLVLPPVFTVLTPPTHAQSILACRSLAPHPRPEVSEARSPHQIVGIAMQENFASVSLLYILSGGNRKACAHRL